jgi:PhzF family phenazine biosynthesis protein
VTDEGVVWTTYPDPTVEGVEGREGASENDGSGDDADRRERVAAALDVPADRMLEDLPLAVGDAGVPFLLVPIDYLTTLRGADPETGAVSEVCAAVGATGIYAFTFDTLAADADVHGRAFAPAAGVPEDPVTGTASAAVAAYLRSSGAFEEAPEELVCEQGHVLDRPGRVRVRLDPLRVGGTATAALDGEVRIPDQGAEEIIEA